MTSNATSPGKQSSAPSRILIASLVQLSRRSTRRVAVPVWLDTRSSQPKSFSAMLMRPATPSASSSSLSLPGSVSSSTTAASAEHVSRSDIGRERSGSAPSDAIAAFALSGADVPARVDWLRGH